MDKLLYFNQTIHRLNRWVIG